MTGHRANREKAIQLEALITSSLAQLTQAPIQEPFKFIAHDQSSIGIRAVYQTTPKEAAKERWIGKSGESKQALTQHQIAMRAYQIANQAYDTAETQIAEIDSQKVLMEKQKRGVRAFSTLSISDPSSSGTHIPISSYMRSAAPQSIHHELISVSIPEYVIVERTSVKLDGLIPLLAISKVIGDTRVFGEGYQNLTYIPIKREADQVLQSAKLIKQSAQSILSQDKAEMESRDIWVNEGEVLEWITLSIDQKDEFLRTLDQSIQLFSDERIKDALIRNSHGLALTEAEIVDLKEDLDARIEGITATYAIELSRYTNSRLEENSLRRLDSGQKQDSYLSRASQGTAITEQDLSLSRGSNGSYLSARSRVKTGGSYAI